MAKNDVTLPAIPADQVYRAVPRSITFHVDGARKVKSDYTFELDGDTALSPILLAASVRQGLVRFVGTATTSAKEGESEKEACDRRFAEMVAGTYKPGQGGGARVDTYTAVLRESVVTALVNNLHLKKGEAVKLAKANTAAAYLQACDKVAESIEGARDHKDKDGKPLTPGQYVYNAMWPKIEGHAKTEADRRDKATGIDFDLGDFAPAVN